MDETWLYYYDPRQSNNQCSGGIAAHSDQNIPSAKFIWNLPRFYFFFSDRSSILFIDYFAKGQTINPECFSYVLVHLKAILKRKLIGKFRKVVLILRVNIPARRELAIQKNLAYLSFQYLDHLNYSPDLAPSDYHLFPGLKKQLNFSHSSSDA
jgi:histone-lysine N-methyltransferase SETMAR